LVVFVFFSEKLFHGPRPFCDQQHILSIRRICMYSKSRLQFGSDFRRWSSPDVLPLVVSG